MAFQLEFSLTVERDFGLRFDQLLYNYTSFGASAESAIEHSGAWILEILDLQSQPLTATTSPVDQDSRNDVRAG